MPMPHLAILGETMAELFNSLTSRTRFTHFVHHLIAFCNRPEEASDVTSGTFVRPIVPDRYVKFRYPRLKCS